MVLVTHVYMWNITQNAIPGEQELILLGGGGHYDPTPLDKVGLKKKSEYEEMESWRNLTKINGFNFAALIQSSDYLNN